MLIAFNLNGWSELIERCCAYIELSENPNEKQGPKSGPNSDTMDYSADLLEEFEKLVRDGDFAGLDNIEVLAVSMAVLMELSPGCRLSLGGILEKMGCNPEYITYELVRIVAGMFFTEGEMICLGQLLSEESMLNRFLVKSASNGESVKGMYIPVTLQEGVLEFVTSGSLSLSEASSISRFYDMPPEEVVTLGDKIEELMNIMASMMLTREGGLLCLKGLRGVGKCFMVRNATDAMDMNLLAIDMAALLSCEASMMPLLKRCVRKALLENDIVYLDINVPVYENQKAVQQVVAYLQTCMRVVVAGCSEDLPEEISISGESRLIEVPAPGRKDQEKYWEFFAKGLSIKMGEDIKIKELSSLYDMTPGRIMEALSTVRSIANYNENEEFEINMEVLSERVRQICSVNFDKLATRLSTPFTLEDLELSQPAMELVKDVISRIKYRTVVNEEFGFGNKLPYGKGTVVALYGPPGTGKTMTATVLGKELGMDVYRIDLSQIRSKYIGESEKNLKAVFDAARYSNAILFFDEADALFSRRTEVSTSNDKNANAETAFLLQKMEEYSGLSILATNTIQNFDPAFKRRLTFMISIDKPDEETRRRLWEKAFPKGAPLDESVRFADYARVSELSGSSIKNAAIAAAYRAASQGRKISHADICEAIDTEYKKIGHMSILSELMSM